MATPLEVAAMAIDGFREELKAKDLRLNNLSEAATSFRRQRDAAIERAEAATKRRATLWRLYRNTLDRARRLRARAQVAEGRLSQYECICGGPSMQPCGSKCKYPLADVSAEAQA